MPTQTLPGSRDLYTGQAGIRRDMQSLFEGLLNQLLGVIARHTNSDGVLDPRAEREILQQADDATTALFVGPDGRHAYAVDGVTPLSPYARALNYWLAWETWQVARHHQDFLREHLPDDIYRWLGTARNFATYDPPLLWPDTRGYSLSDRIWESSLNTRKKVSGILSEAIHTGRASTSLSRSLEQFLLPNRAALRTKKPYGTDASFDAMRLARTEISLHHTRITFAAAEANPFVDGMDWALSASHPKFDICDGLATIGMSGERLKDPYPLGSAPMVVSSSHPQCICNNRPAVSQSTDAVIAELRGRMERGEPPPPTPVNLTGFVIALIGAVLAGDVDQRAA